MCGIVGYTGPREAGAAPDRGPEEARVPRLRLRRDRHPLQRRIHDPPLAREAREPGREARGRAGRRRDGDRPHALGDPWPADRDQRAPADRLHGTDRRRAQRYLRELRGAQGRPREGGAPVQERDRHRGLRPRGRGRVPGRPSRGRSCGGQEPDRRLRRGRVLEPRARSPRDRALGAADRPRARRRRELRRVGPGRPGALDPRRHLPRRRGRGARRREGRFRPQRRGRAPRAPGPPDPAGTRSPPRRAATATTWPRRSTSSRRRSPSRWAARSPSRPASSISIRRC